MWISVSVAVLLFCYTKKQVIKDSELTQIWCLSGVRIMIRSMVSSMQKEIGRKFLMVMECAYHFYKNMHRPIMIPLQQI